MKYIAALITLVWLLARYGLNGASEKIDADLRAAQRRLRRLREKRRA